MPQTLLQICQAAATELQLNPLPTSIIGSGTQEARELLRFANQAGESIMREYDWAELTETGSSITIAESDHFRAPLPDDAARIIRGDIYAQTGGTRTRITGPLSFRDFRDAVASAQPGQEPVYALGRGAHVFGDTISAGVSVSFGYISREWVRNGATRRELFADDGDTTVFNDQLMINRMVFEYRNAKQIQGFDVALQRYQSLFQNLVEAEAVEVGIAGPPYEGPPSDNPTLIEMCQAVAIEVGIARPPRRIAESVEASARLLLRYANRAGQQIVLDSEWAALTETVTVNAAARLNYFRVVFPDQTDRLIAGDVYIDDSGTLTKVTGPLTYRDFQNVVASAMEGQEPVYAQADGGIVLVGAGISAGTAIRFGIVSNLYVRASDGTFRASFQADTDTVRIDPELLQLRMVYEYRAGQSPGGELVATALAAYDTLLAERRAVEIPEVRIAMPPFEAVTENMSLLKLCQHVAAQVQVDPPRRIVTGVENSARMLLAFANKAAREIMLEHDWEVLVEETSAETTVEGNHFRIEIPAQANRVITASVYLATSATQRIRVDGPFEWRAFQDWIVRNDQEYKGQRLVRPIYALTKNGLALWGPGLSSATGGQTIHFGIVNKNVIRSAAATAKAMFDADTDTTVIDDELLTRHMIYQYYLNTQTEAAQLIAPRAEIEYRKILQSVMDNERDDELRTSPLDDLFDGGINNVYGDEVFRNDVLLGAPYTPGTGFTPVTPGGEADGVVSSLELEFNDSTRVLTVTLGRTNNLADLTGVITIPGGGSTPTPTPTTHTRYALLTTTAATPTGAQFQASTMTSTSEAIQVAAFTANRYLHFFDIYDDLSDIHDSRRNQRRNFSDSPAALTVDGVDGYVYSSKRALRSPVAVTWELRR